MSSDIKNGLGKDVKPLYGVPISPITGKTSTDSDVIMQYIHERYGHDLPGIPDQYIIGTTQINPEYTKYIEKLRTIKMETELKELKESSVNLEKKEEGDRPQYIPPKKSLVQSIRDKENTFSKPRPGEEEKFISASHLEKIEKAKSAEEQEYLEASRFKQNDICCIVGFAPSWNEAPYDRKDIDFWGLNDVFVYIRTLEVKPKFNLWFEVHDIENSPSKQQPHHQEFLKTTKIPILTQKHWEQYPSSLPYPRDFVKKFYKKSFTESKTTDSFRDYSNQISWMIALAIIMGYKEIMVYGVDMAQETEYFHQKPSCNFFLGYAAGAGIKITIPASCELLTGCDDYGFSTDNKKRIWVKKTIQTQQETIIKMHQRIAELEFTKEKIANEFNDNKFKANLDIDIINGEIHRLITQIEVSKNLIECISTLPATMEEINKKKPDLLNGYKKVIEGSNIQIEKLEKEKKEVAAKTERRERDLYVNTTMLNDEKKAAEESIQKLHGHISGNKDRLNKNLV